MIQITKGKFYLTTAIPYVNAAPHLGHALEFVQTDAIARYQRLEGKEVELVTGSDENSLKNVHAAEAKGVTPAELCESNAAAFRVMADAVGLSYTCFRKTSDRKLHWPGIEELWKKIGRTGDIYKKKYKGLYCVGCESFYEESELPGGVCPNVLATLNGGGESIWPEVLPLATTVQRIEGRDGRGVGTVPAAAVAFQPLRAELAL